MLTKCVFLFPIFILFYLFLFNFIDAEERNANLDKNIKKLNIGNFLILHHPQADCFLSPPKVSFDFQIFGFTN